MAETAPHGRDLPGRDRLPGAERGSGHVSQHRSPEGGYAGNPGLSAWIAFRAGAGSALPGGASDRRPSKCPGSISSRRVGEHIEAERVDVGLDESAILVRWPAGLEPKRKRWPGHARTSPWHAGGNGTYRAGIGRVFFEAVGEAGRHTPTNARPKATEGADATGAAGRASAGSQRYCDPRRGVAF